MSRRAAKQPFVSVVMAVRDAERHISRAVDSVLTQDCPDIQLVVADRASRDGTLRILTGIAEREISLDVVACDDADEAAALDAAVAAAAPLIEEGMLSLLKGKALLRSRIDALGLRMALCASQVSYLVSYLEDVARVAVVPEAVYHATAVPEGAELAGGAGLARRERDHERLLDLIASWHMEDDRTLSGAVHRLHLRQIVAAIERIVLARGISSIERTERVRDILEAPSTQRTIQALDKGKGPVGLMYRLVARRNVMGCCLGAHIGKLARVSHLPLARHPLSMLGLL